MPPTDSRALASISIGRHAAGGSPSRPASRILTACVTHGQRRLEHANSMQRSFEKSRGWGGARGPGGHAPPHAGAAAQAATQVTTQAASDSAGAESEPEYDERGGARLSSFFHAKAISHAAYPYIAHILG